MNRGKGGFNLNTDVQYFHGEFPKQAQRHTDRHTQTVSHTLGALTCDNAVVGRFQHSSIKLNDVLMTQDTENLGLDKEKKMSNNPFSFILQYQLQKSK